jgi:hypothetical protein
MKKLVFLLIVPLIAVSAIAQKPLVQNTEAVNSSRSHLPPDPRSLHDSTEKIIALKKDFTDNSGLYIIKYEYKRPMNKVADTINQYKALVTVFKIENNKSVQVGHSIFGKYCPVAGKGCPEDNALYIKQAIKN